MQENNATNDATDAQERQFGFMHALAARDVDARDIKQSGQEVRVSLPSAGNDTDRAKEMAEEFGFVETATCPIVRNSRKMMTFGLQEKYSLFH